MNGQNSEDRLGKQEDFISRGMSIREAWANADAKLSSYEKEEITPEEFGGYVKYFQWCSDSFTEEAEFDIKRPEAMCVCSSKMYAGESEAFYGNWHNLLMHACFGNLYNLRVAGSEVSALNVDALCMCIQWGNLTSLSISGIDPEQQEQIYSAIGKNETIGTCCLVACGNLRMPALSEALKTNSSITSLDLHHTAIDHSGIVSLSDALKVNSSITRLNMAYSGINYVGMRVLSEWLEKNSSVTVLDLESNSICDDGVKPLSEALKVNSSVTQLNLSWCNIRELGASHLSEMLKVNSSLVTLNASRNYIGDSGAIALSDSLRTNSSLTRLFLMSCGISEKGKEALADALESSNITLATLITANM